jgi:Protein of unknown function DUF115
MLGEVPNNQRLLAKLQGYSAKGAFLASVAADDAASSSDRAMAFLALLDDIDNILAAFSGEEVKQLRIWISAAVANLPNKSTLLRVLDPNSCIAPSDIIEGASVKRVFIRPGTSVKGGLDLARIELTSGRNYYFKTEYTNEAQELATLQLINTRTKQVLGETTLKSGYNKFAGVSLNLNSTKSTVGVTLRLINRSATKSVFWYQTSVCEVRPPDALHDIVETFSREFRKIRAPDQAFSIFRPVTTELLTLKDVERLSTLHNKFSGQRIFIMGNGPSLNKTPLDLLKNEYVFGLNRVSLLFERLSWRPTFFTAFDVRVVPDNAEEFSSLDIPYKFFSARYKELMGEKSNHYWHHTKGFYEGFESSFEPTVIYSGFGGGGTIAVIAIELAFFMGFREIYLIGTDVSYTVPTTVRQSGADIFGNGIKLELESTRDDDANHFDPRYFGRGKKWHNPNVQDMKIGFARAASYIEDRGGALINATVGGELNEIPRVEFESLF